MSPILRSAARLLAIFLALLPAACGKGEGNSPAPKAEAKAGGKSVSVAPPQKQFLAIEAVGASQDADMLALPGRVGFRPQAQSAVGSPVAGRVVQLLVRAGETVKSGAPLLVIESADASAARAAYDQAVTRVATADATYRRHAEMMERGVGTEVERQEAEARLKEARAEHARAGQAVSLLGGGQGNRVTVRAPADGIVMAIRVPVGASVAPGGEALVELGDPTRLQVIAQVTESDLRRVSIGAEAEVEIPALAARVKARVETLNPRVDAESRRAQAYLALAAPVDGLRAGMLAQVSLRAAGDAAITVPVSAVLIKQGKQRVVYVEKADGSFEAREVQTGRVQDGRVAILQGLKSGEKIVVRGALLLDTQAELLL